MISRLKCPHEKTIIYLACLAALLVFLLGASFNLGDSDSYFDFARYITHFHGPTRAERTCGYPILLILSTYTLTHSVIGILFIQAAMGIGISWLIYRICLFFSKRFAFIMALLAIVSLLPYNFGMVIFHDQSVLFLLLYLSYSLLALKEDPTYKNAFVSLLCFGILTFFRPTYSLLLPIILLIFFIVLRKNPQKFIFLKLTLKTLGVIFALQMATQGIYYLYYFHHQNKYHRNEAITTAGIQFFDNTYRLSQKIPGFFSDGEKTEIFRNVLINHFSHSNNTFADFQKIKNNLNKSDYDFYFAKYQHQPETLVNVLLENPSQDHYWFLVNLFRNDLGEKLADKQFLNVVLEEYRYHPRILFYIILDGFEGYLFRTPSDIQFYPFNFYEYPPQDIDKIMHVEHEKIFYTSPPLSHLFNLKPYFKSFSSFNAFWAFGYRCLFPIISFVALTGFCCSFIFLLRLFLVKRKAPKEIFFILTLGLIYLGYIVPMLVFVDARFRYQSAGFLLLFMIAGITIRKIILASNKRYFSIQR